MQACFLCQNKRFLITVIAYAEAGRGRIMAETPDQIARIDDTHCRVRSQSRNVRHGLISTELGRWCSC